MRPKVECHKVQRVAPGDATRTGTHWLEVTAQWLSIALHATQRMPTQKLKRYTHLPFLEIGE
jgi:hypothetical protein